MRLFNKLPGYVRAAPGLERVVLLHMPWIFTVGAALFMAPSILLRLDIWWDLHPLRRDAIISIVDIYATGGFILYCNLVIATTIGAFVVLVMKGPAYVADAYPLIDADTPAGARRWGRA